MSGPPRASVLIRTRDGGEQLRRTVAAVRAQRGVDFEAVILDTGPAPGASEPLAGGPVRVVRFEGPFSHARSSNAAARAAASEILVFLSDDAVPADDAWLRTLLAPLDSPEVAATFARQAPGPVASVLEARDLRRAYPDRGPSPTILSNASSALRRSLWREHPFDESLPLAEDLEWGRWALARGLRVVYVPEAVVIHAHGYDAGALRARYREEGRALARLGLPVLGGGLPEQAWLRGLPGDLWAVLRAGRFAELGPALRYHLEMYRALAEGAAAGPGSAPRAGAA
ncbi:MAG: glycosyltransferase [Candidatus Eisenbacteria bacterium]|nr:glycosyltransferase [Candidatus Eisenbacteria bacterium]